MKNNTHNVKQYAENSPRRKTSPNVELTKHDFTKFRLGTLATFLTAALVLAYANGRSNTDNQNTKTSAPSSPLSDKQLESLPRVYETARIGDGADDLILRAENGQIINMNLIEKVRTLVEYEAGSHGILQAGGTYTVPKLPSDLINRTQP